MDLMMRRRALMGMGGKESKIEGIRILVDPRHSTALFADYSVPYVNKMYIDGTEVEVRNDYNFSDSNIHEVILQLTDNTSVPQSMFFLNTPNNYELLVDFPETYVSFGDGAIRNICYMHGANGTVVIRSKIMPTFGKYNFLIGSTKIYVPDELIADYTTMLQNDEYAAGHVSQLRPLSEYVEQ